MSKLEPSHFDLMVIGGGPAGYTAAVRAAQLGARVILIEKDRLGGACLNHACVPTKFLRYAAEILHVTEKAPRFGITTEIKNIDWQAMQSRCQSLIDSQADGMKWMLDDYGICIINGEARLLAGRIVSVFTGTHEDLYQADKVIIATGSRPAQLNIPGADGIMSSQELLQITSPPRRLAIIGAGAVGVELATIFARFGTTVSLIEALPRILPNEDAELTGLLGKELKKASVGLYTSSRVQCVEKVSSGYQVILAGGGAQAIEVDQVAMCIGQIPCLDNLAAAGLRSRRGALSVDKHLFTGAEGIYAAGDVTGRAMLAYVAIMQGRIAAENALGQASVMKYDAIPHCVFSMPELTSVGLTEEAARVRGKGIDIGRFPFSANTAATIYSERRGLVKVIAEAASGRLLGVHILGPGASALIHEAALAIKTHATIGDLQRTLHIHPSLAETIWDAAFDATGDAIRAKRPAGTQTS